MLIALFWFSFIGSCFSYFIYPGILGLTPRRKLGHKKNRKAFDAPKVSLIVTAYNEELRIREKIENCLNLKYPNLEIFIASDASTDQTDNIAKEYIGRGVSLARSNQRKGKEHAQLHAIKKVTGEILVFSDVATSIPEGAIDCIVKHFDDPDVGAVSSEDRFISRDGSIAGEGAYVRYEMWLRNLESERAGLVGLSGSFFAARRSVCAEWDIQSPSDFNTALNCARQGLVAVTAPDVLGYYQDVAEASREYHRKVRTIIRGLTALSRHPEVLNPVKFGWFSFQVFGHKLMRWLAPWFQVLLFVFSLLLVGRGAIYATIFFSQVAFYGLVLIGYVVPGVRGVSFVKIPYYFVQSNLAVAHASLSFLMGRRMTVWTPSKR